MFASVPSDVSFVGVVDLESLTNEIRNKVEAWGVNTSYALVFGEGYNIYLTGFVSDSDLFKRNLEKSFNEKVVDEDGYSVCGNVVYSANRFWVCLNSRNSIVVRDIKHFDTLSNAQSFLSSKEADNLIESDEEIRGWGDIKGTLNCIGLDFTTKATVQMASEALFGDAGSYRFALDFEKDGLLMNLTLINSKGGIAGFLYPTGKIDAHSVADTGLQGSGIFMLAISPEFTKMLVRDTASKGVSVLGVLARVMSPIDGTVTIAADKKSQSGVVPVKGGNVTDLVQLLKQQYTEVKQVKGGIAFGNGKPTGGIDAALAAKVLEGYMGGFVVSLEDSTDGNWDYAALKLKPEKGGMTFEVEVKAKDKQSLLQGLSELSESYR